MGNFFPNILPSPLSVGPIIFFNHWFLALFFSQNSLFTSGCYTFVLDCIMMFLVYVYHVDKFILLLHCLQYIINEVSSKPCRNNSSNLWNKVNGKVMAFVGSFMEWYPVSFWSDPIEGKLACVIVCSNQIEGKIAYVIFWSYQIEGKLACVIFYTVIYKTSHFSP